MPFAAEFHDMMPDELNAIPGTTDAYGSFVASGSTLVIPCRIEGQSRLIRDIAGREVVSSMQVITGGYNNLTTHQHRYTLPSRFDPATALTALMIEKETDEAEPCYEIVFFP